MIVIVTGLMLWAFLFTNDFRIDSVAIDGLQHGESGVVLAEAALLDRSAFRAEPDAAAERIARLPFVESVTVDLEFPGEATITIVERAPVLNVEHGGEAVIVSGEALAMGSGFIEGLPTLRLDSRGAPLETALSREVILAVTAIAGVYGPDVMLVWSPDVGLVMELPDGALVNFGAPENIEAKLTVLTAIEAQLDEGWSELDLSVPTRPSYR
jgi:cell division protein FtsQ